MGADTLDLFVVHHRIWIPEKCTNLGPHALFVKYKRYFYYRAGVRYLYFGAIEIFASGKTARQDINGAMWLTKRDMVAWTTNFMESTFLVNGRTVKSTKNDLLGRKKLLLYYSMGQRDAYSC
jgi:hypothetical protein